MAPSLRQQFSWTLPANLLFGLSTLLIVIVLNKFGGAETVGRYGMALAIVMPAYMFASMRLATLIATTTSPNTDLRYYFVLRTRLSVAATLAVLALSVGLVRYGWMDESMVVILVLLAIAKSFELASEVCCGIFQRANQLGWVAGSLICNGILMSTGFVITFAYTRELPFAIAASATGRLTAFLLHDFPRACRLIEDAEPLTRHRSRNAVRIFLEAFPLGITAILLSLTSSVPRLFLAWYHSEELLGVFVSVAVVMQAGTLVFRAVEQPALPRLAAHLRMGEKRQFASIFGFLTLAFTLAALLGGAISISIGSTLLGLLFTEDYSQSGMLLASLFATTAVTQIAGMTESCMIAIRKNAIQLPMHLTTFSLCLLCSVLCIPSLDIFGAVLAIAICRFPFIGIGVWFLFRHRVHHGAGSSNHSPILQLHRETADEAPKRQSA